jgi:hypothetical protein
MLKGQGNRYNGAKKELRLPKRRYPSREINLRTGLPIRTG